MQKKKEKRIGLRIEYEEDSQLKTIAKKERTTKSELIRHIIRLFIKDYRKD